MSTVHANGPEEALLRLESLALSGDERVSATTVRRQLHSALDLVIQVERSPAGRRVAAVAAVGPGGVEETVAC